MSDSITTPITPSSVGIKTITQSTRLNVVDYSSGSTTFTDLTNYYTKADANLLLAGKANVSHTHSFSSLSDLPNTLAGYGITDAAAVGHTHTFASLTSKPTTLSGYGITDGQALALGGGTAKTDAFLSSILARTGKPLYGDPDFATTNNGIVAYNNLGNGAVVITRDVDATAPNKSKNVLTITKNASTASPGLGGFWQGVVPQANQVYAMVLIANIPVGYSLFGSGNPTGTGATDTWITSTAGTGKWRTYVRMMYAGEGGTFSSTGHVYLSGGTSTDAFVWKLAYANVFHLGQDAGSNIEDYQVKSVGFSKLTSLPTTLAGHGITDAYTRVQAQSRGMNLLTNGFGTTGDNTNFSQFTFNAAEVYSGGGSFTTAVLNAVHTQDEFVPVDPAKYYRFTFAAKTLNLVTGNNYAYGTSTSYDVDLNSILPIHYTFDNDTYTTLAAPLKPGDTTITLTSAAAWDTQATAANNYIKIHSFKNTKGYYWPAKSYSRNVGGLGQYTAANVNLSTNVVTLTTPWTIANPDDVNGWPVGTPIGTCYSASSYQYFTNVGNTPIPTTWTTYSGVIGGTFTNTGQVVSVNFPTGTAFIKLGFLANRTSTGVGGTAGNVTAFSAMHFSENTIQNYTGGLTPSPTNTINLNGAGFTFTNGILTSFAGTITGLTDSQITSVGWSKILSKPTTLSGFGITDAYTKTEVDSALSGKASTTHSHDFSTLTNKPTTLAGYGITDGGSGSGSGDMAKATYDTNNSGVVDDSEKLAGIAATSYARIDLTNTFTKYQRIPYDSAQDTNLLMLSRPSPTSGQSVNGFDFKDAAGNTFTGGLYQIYSTSSFYETRLYGKGNVVIHTNDGGGTVNGTVRFVTTNSSGTNATWIVDNTKITAPDNSTVLTTKTQDRLGRFYTSNEFVSSVSTNEWVQYASGTGVSISQSNITGLNNAVGTVRFVTGTTPTGRVAIANPVPIIRFNQGTTNLRAILSLATLSNTTETYVIRVGYIDSVTGDSTYGAYFRYTDGVNSGKWQAVIRNNSVETVIDTGVLASTGVLRKFEINTTAAGVITFKIDNATVGTNSTSLAITAGSETGYGVAVTKTVGSSSVSVTDVDFMDVEYLFASSR
ncbi:MULTISPECIES: beta strand repeat-containing protein [Deinococcus]|uniref:Beta strand repeat-containing protein n=1 Tax=Deinococcus rufus TaxID=2136097 RepID=A0ABV7Z812_9DEIO|nr:hypothetical protein [Deinococcus sp. AB2017081]WQE94440.1 hypothetical protein U2P90_13625 [Deinococcus sp. AB2017081]